MLHTGSSDVLTWAWNDSAMLEPGVPKFTYCEQSEWKSESSYAEIILHRHSLRSYASATQYAYTSDMAAVTDQQVSQSTTKVC